MLHTYQCGVLSTFFDFESVMNHFFCLLLRAPLVYTYALARFQLSSNSKVRVLASTRSRSCCGKKRLACLARQKPFTPAHADIKNPSLASSCLLLRQQKPQRRDRSVKLPTPHAPGAGRFGPRRAGKRFEVRTFIKLGSSSSSA